MFKAKESPSVQCLYYCICK